jgi:PAT family beta-lactamase induction signal transducer AmpG
MNPAKSPCLLAVLALCIAFFSASQDVAIDAYRADLLNTQERGIGAAMSTVGYRVAMLVAGGVALALADQMGWCFTYLLMAGFMLFGLLVTLKAPVLKDNNRPSSLLEAVIDPLKNFLSRPAAWFLVLFIMLYNFGSAFTLSLSTAFLLRGLGFSLTDVGLLYKTAGVLATLLGSLLGGILLARFTLFSSLLGFGILQAIANLSFMLLAIVGKNYTLMMSSVFIENFCSGLAMVAFVALLMSLCDKRYTATQYALFSALAAVGRVYVGSLAGVIINYLNWPQFFLCSFLLGLPGIFLLLLIKQHIMGSNLNTDEEKTQSLLRA